MFVFIDTCLQGSMKFSSGINNQSVRRSQGMNFEAC